MATNQPPLSIIQMTVAKLWLKQQTAHTYRILRNQHTRCTHSDGLHDIRQLEVFAVKEVHASVTCVLISQNILPLLPQCDLSEMSGKYGKIPERKTLTRWSSVEVYRLPASLAVHTTFHCPGYRTNSHRHHPLLKLTSNSEPIRDSFIHSYHLYSTTSKWLLSTQLSFNGWCLAH